MKNTFSSLSAVACALVFAAAAHAETRVSVDFQIGAPPPVVVKRGPPRPIVEKVVVSPGPGRVWVGGHHSWRGGRWVWVPGAWLMPPQPTAVWVEGRWDRGTRNWVEGYWNVPVPTPPPAVVVVEAPPPMRQEVIVTRPTAQHVWIPGYWVWRGRHHEWIAGHWELPPRGRSVWVAPAWEHRGNSYVFIEGSWR